MRIRSLLQRIEIKAQRWYTKAAYGVAFKIAPNTIVQRGATLKGKRNSISIGSGTVIESGAILSTDYGGNIYIGDNCKIAHGAMILTYGGDIAIGNNSGVGPYTVLYGHGGLTIGNYVWFAAHCTVIPANHGIDSLELPIYSQPLKKLGIEIENDVWIGTGVRVLDGVKIGHGSVVGAGSVVTKPIPALSICVGVPAKVVKVRQDQQ